MYICMSLGLTMAALKLELKMENTWLWSHHAIMRWLRDCRVLYFHNMQIVYNARCRSTEPIAKFYGGHGDSFTNYHIFRYSGISSQFRAACMHGLLQTIMLFQHLEWDHNLEIYVSHANLPNPNNSVCLCVGKYGMCLLMTDRSHWIQRAVELSVNSSLFPQLDL